MRSHIAVKLRRCLKEPSSSNHLHVSITIDHCIQGVKQQGSELSAILAVEADGAGSAPRRGGIHVHLVALSAWWRHRRNMLHVAKLKKHACFLLEKAPHMSMGLMEENRAKLHYCIQPVDRCKSVFGRKRPCFFTSRQLGSYETDAHLRNASIYNYLFIIGS